MNIDILSPTNAGIVKEEISQIGKVSWSTYLSIISSASNSDKVRVAKVIFIILIMFIAQCLIASSEYFLGVWANSTNQNDSHHFFIYILLCLAALAFILIKPMIFLMELLNGSNQLHLAMFNAVLFAPMEFFESNPIGRILNRFSKDQLLTDEYLPKTAYDGVRLFFVALMAVILAGFTNFYLVLIMIPILIIMVVISKWYLTTSRVIKRLDATTRSPIFSHFTVMFVGLDIIRSFNKQQLMMSDALSMIDVNNRQYLMFQACGRWIGFNLDICTVIITSFTTFSCVYISNHESNTNITAIGSTLLYMLMLGGLLQYTIRQFAEIENCMVSVERIAEYGQLKREQNENQNDINVDAEWPTYGSIKFINLSVKYRKNLPNVLHNLNISIEHNAKIGIVGRTGSGKSTLFLAMFRMLNPENVCGHIEIDGINLNNLSLQQSRSVISIIPQQIIMFSETLRYNIDPFEMYSDEQIYGVLKDVLLYDFVHNKLPNKLLTNMSENGTNFSVGELQLICISRALLDINSTKILLIDEATSNIDKQSDAMIQNILATKFKNKTILTIAHRLNTILNYDKILVLDKGKVVEFDKPQNLLQKDFRTNPNALFARMYHQYTEKE